jgi:hypothetical protein
MVDNKEVGSILFEIKNRVNWDKGGYQNFVEKVNKADHTYYIYIHNKPVGEKGSGDFKRITPNLTFDQRNKIFITNFDTAVSLVYVLRSVLLDYVRKIEVSENRSSLAEKLFEFVNSPEFKNYFVRVEENRATAQEYFEKIIDNAQKGKVELLNLKDEVKELLVRLNKEA